MIVRELFQFHVQHGQTMLAGRAYIPHDDPDRDVPMVVESLHSIAASLLAFSVDGAEVTINTENIYSFKFSITNPLGESQIDASIDRAATALRRDGEWKFRWEMTAEEAK